MRITELEDVAATLSDKEYELLMRFYEIKIFTGELKLPAEMKDWVRTRFNSVERVERQRIVSVKNRFTGEHSLFNELRAVRPKEGMQKVVQEVEPCRFCNPAEQTPMDSFGRIKGRYCVTASNLTKYDSYHGLVIFNEHNPQVITEDRIADYLRTGERWFESVCKDNGGDMYKFFLWNCLWRSGASIIHGHMQLTASKTRYGKLDVFDRVVSAYSDRYGSDYLSDLCKVHGSLGLMRTSNDDRILFYITPVKEKEIVVVSTAHRSDGMAHTIYKLLRFYRDMGVMSYNLAIFQSGSYHVARLVDRGDLDDRTSDIGAMELYAASVIAYDPFKLAQEFRV